MQTVWISLGSNVPDARRRIAEACEKLKLILNEQTASEPYVTPALGQPAPDYTNCVVCGKTALTINEIEQFCKQTEAELGRRRLPGKKLVEIDLDLVVVGSSILRPTDFNHSYFRRGYLALRHIE